ncbi:MAG: hypothetical protein ACI8ZZ_001751, partial [Gammaproteobacteria bacterium]
SAVKRVSQGLTKRKLPELYSKIAKV